MRRLLAAAGVAALGIGALVPVARSVEPDNAHRLEFWEPVRYDPYTGRPDPQPKTAEHGARVWDTNEVVTVKADFREGDAVTKWEVRLVPRNGGTPSTCREEIAPQNGSYPGTVYISCPWDTTRAADRTLDGRTPYEDVDDQGLQRNWRVTDRGASVNGPYTIEVTVWNAGRPRGLVTPEIPGGQAFTLFEDPKADPPWRQVTVTNGVAEPTGVSAAFDPASSRINVTWAPNPEPDVAYIIEEKVGDGQWSPAGEVPGNATRYDRVIEHPGKYQYRVRANRPFAPGPSEFVAAQAVEVAQVTPPTTAAPNGADGAPDGGDPGVFIPGDTSTTTGPGRAQGSGPGRKGPSANRSGPTSGGARPSGAGRPTGTTAEPGEAEGEGPDGGFSTVLPYDQPQEDFADLEGGDEEAGPETLAGGVVPKPRDTRQLLIFMAISLTLFVFAMQITLLLRKSRPVAATANQTYQDDFDDWLGGF